MLGAGRMGQPFVVVVLKSVLSGRWEGASGWRGDMYTCGQFMLMYGKKPSQYSEVKECALR